MPGTLPPMHPVHPLHRPRTSHANPAASSDDRPSDGGGIGHFGFRLVDEEDLYRAVEEVERAEGGWSGEGEHPDGQPFAYVTDPDGYVIEL
jgi:catechol 2,3-dioxygenase-like lactoylglutathione lyase family enzyme